MRCVRHVRVMTVRQAAVPHPEGPSRAVLLFQVVAVLAGVVGFIAILPFLIALAAGGLTLWGLVALIRTWVRTHRRAKAADAEKAAAEETGGDPVAFPADRRQIPIPLDPRDNPRFGEADADASGPVVLEPEVVARKAA